MKILFLAFVLFFIFYSAQGQLTKGNWLTGGSLAYSKSESAGSDATNSKTSVLGISSNVGYFFRTKVALGFILNAQFTSEKYPQVNGTINTIRQNKYSIGPFIRYYFLNQDNRVNLLSQVGLTYSILSNKSIGSVDNKFKSVDYSIDAGPVIFFNSSVGMEFLIGYNSSNAVDFDSRGRSIKFKIGFQIHLSKD